MAAGAGAGDVIPSGARLCFIPCLTDPLSRLVESRTVPDEIKVDEALLRKTMKWAGAREFAHVHVTRAAHHEAGHVVAALSLGGIPGEPLYVEYTTVDADIRATRHHRPDRVAAHTRVLVHSAINPFDKGMYLLAGPIAEDQFMRASNYGPTLRHLYARSRQAEWCRVRDSLLAPWLRNADRDMFPSIVQNVEKLIDTSWSEVTAIAEAVLQRGTLNREAIAQVIGRTSRLYPSITQVRR